MDFLTLYVYGSLALAFFFSVFYIVSLCLKKYSIIDSCWGSGFIIVTFTSWYLGGASLSGSGSFISLMVLLWGGRLTAHLVKRFITTGEDRRYKELVVGWKRWIPLQVFLKIFGLQGILLLIMSYPIVRVNGLEETSVKFGTFMIIGLSLFLVGFLWEAISDYQLSQFVKSKTPGEIMQTGLWRFSRHPNYFGEILVWWGIALFAFGVSSDYFVFLSPIVISIFLKWVTGVPPIEKKYEKNKNYQAYKNTTSCIIPWNKL